MDEAMMRIGEVARRTGLPAATIRAWQRRYGLLAPERTDGGQRLYSEDDVAVLLEVSARVADGWALAAAAGTAPGTEHGLARTATQTAARAPGAKATERDHHALVAVHDASRAMLRAARPVDVVAALVDLVVALGGEVGPATEETDDVLLIDLGLGETSPLLARAEAFSVARLRLEAVLPRLVDDARHMVALLRAAGR